jgi:protein TonB
MSDSLSARAAGTLPVFWRVALFTGVLSMHGLGFALMPEMGARIRGNTTTPTILQASWIVATPAEAPAVIAPEPAPLEATPAPRTRPVTKSTSKPVLVKSATAPEPAAEETIAAPDAPLREEAPTEESGESDASAREKSLTAGAPGASASATASAGQSAPEAPVIPPSHANYLSNPRPEYPAPSRAQGEQGVVFLYIRVSAEGKTHSVALHKSCGYARLDQAAMEAVQRWRFVPARQGGRPVAGAVIVPVRFDLRS